MRECQEGGTPSKVGPKRGPRDPVEVAYAPGG